MRRNALAAGRGFGCGGTVERKYCLAPVVDARTGLLVLGSLPGEISLAKARYYAHPRNQFWLLIGAVIGTDLAALPYEGRLDRLLEAGIGLWDAVGSAARKGSLDGGIREPVPNDLAGLAARLPRLEGVAFNGALAARLGRRALAGVPGLELIDLPSSSPARTLPFGEKLRRWRALGAFTGNKP